MKIILAALFVVAGICHFLFTSAYMRAMPPVLPAPRLLVWVSGVCEILLGAGLMFLPSSIPAAWGLIALLIAVFPANIHMAVHAGDFPQVPAWTLWARMPLQGVLIAWVWVYTRR